MGAVDSSDGWAGAHIGQCRVPGLVERVEGCIRGIRRGDKCRLQANTQYTHSRMAMSATKRALTHVAAAHLDKCLNFVGERELVQAASAPTSPRIDP